MPAKWSDGRTMLDSVDLQDRVTILERQMDYLWQILSVATVAGTAVAVSAGLAASFVLTHPIGLPIGLIAGSAMGVLLHHPVLPRNLHRLDQ